MKTERWLITILQHHTCYSLSEALLLTSINPKYDDKVFIELQDDDEYRKVASSNTSRLEAHAGFFRTLMKGIFDPYVL